jgi:hypothetical protein
VQHQSVLFSVFRDDDIGLDDLAVQGAWEEATALDYDLDCVSSDEDELRTPDLGGLLNAEQDRCLADLSWAMEECRHIGELCVRDVLLRNTDIHDRVSLPGLFDRFGKLKSDLLMTQDSPGGDAVDMLLDRMSLA